MSGDYINNNEITIDFYSNDHQKDLTVEADIISYGEGKLEGNYFVVTQDPEFAILAVYDDEDVSHNLSPEESDRVDEILDNVYWNMHR